MRAGSILVNALLIASLVKFEPHWTSHTAVQALETTLTMMALTFAASMSGTIAVALFALSLAFLANVDH
jgi:ABC-type phosphate/phosphonate transport system permease subunit